MNSQASAQPLTVLEFQNLNVRDVGNYLLAEGINPSFTALLTEHQIDGDTLYGTEDEVIKMIDLKHDDCMKIKRVMNRLAKNPFSVDTKKDRLTVLMFKNLNKLDLAKYLKSRNIKLSVVNLLAKYKFNGNILHDAEFCLLEKIGLAFNDFLKLRQVIKRLSKKPRLSFPDEREFPALQPQRSCSTNEYDDHGHSPLHVACLERNLSKVKCLVEEDKMDVKAVNKRGKSALALARDWGHTEIETYIEGVIVSDAKITESALGTFDKKLMRAWLVFTQSTSGLDSSVIEKLYGEGIGGRSFLCLARDREKRKDFPCLKPGEWLNIQEFVKASFESDRIVNQKLLNYTESQPPIDAFRGTFGRLKVFDRKNVNLKDAKEIGRGTYGYALLVTVAGLADPVVLKRNYHPVNSWKSYHAIDEMGTHPNILNIIGVVTIDSDICILSEYCAKGSLKKLVMEGKIEPSDKVLLEYIEPIVNGLIHLHQKGIIHRDLRADNILVHSNGLVVIADYGLSRKLHFASYYKIVLEDNLPRPWMAPECLQSNECTFKGDVWSLGVTIYELLTRGDKPYAVELKDTVWKKVLDGIIDRSISLIDGSFSDRFKGASFPVPWKVIQIARECLDVDEKRRPCARGVLQRVREERSLGYMVETDSSLADKVDLEKENEVKNIRFDVEIVLQGGNLRTYWKDIAETVGRIKGLESTSFYYAGTSHWASEYLERRMSDKSTLLNFEFSTTDFEHWRFIETNFFRILEELNSTCVDKLHAKVLKPQYSTNQILVIIWHKRKANLYSFIDNLRDSVQNLEFEISRHLDGNIREVVETVKTKRPKVSPVEDIPLNMKIPPFHVAMKLNFTKESLDQKEEIRKGTQSCIKVVFSCDATTMLSIFNQGLRGSSYAEYHRKYILPQQVVLVEPNVRDLIIAFPSQRLRELAEMLSRYIRYYSNGGVTALFQIIVQYIGLRSFEAPTSLPLEDKKSFQHYITGIGNKSKMASIELFLEVPDKGFWKTHIQTTEAEPWDFYQKWCVDLKLAEENEDTKKISWPPSKRKQREVIKLLTAYVISRDKKPREDDTLREQVPDQAKGSKTKESDNNRVVVFDLYIILIHRFGYGDEMIEKAKRFYLEEFEDEKKILRLRMAPWYHGELTDVQAAIIMRKDKNIGKFLVREAIVKNSKRLTVEYSRLFEKGHIEFRKKQLTITKSGFKYLVSHNPSKQEIDKIKNALRKSASSIKNLHEEVIGGNIQCIHVIYMSIWCVSGYVFSMNRKKKLLIMYISIYENINIL
ncbi:hypothetical protein AAMO2058_001250200 [Amorphochlora amoebiformis]